ncbi:tRNA lysidine(34) synthetase TilS [Winogradskyella pelagia]|nr:tRNA lysidine(34) synthetase TilS [Winogradskyella sp. DF17]
MKEKKLLIAISGGVDSVVLAWLCHRLKLEFSLAHCNFNLREEESNADEEFVIQLANTLDVEVFVQNFDTKAYVDSNKCSIQMAARELRYDWLQELAGQLNYDYILTAHHADDNLETFLINFTRGTGLNGLTGIPIVNENIVRPLLYFSREEILNYAQSQHIEWREDSSNSGRKYLRNKLRHEVVPVLKSINPQLLDIFQDTINHLNDTADIVEESLNAVAKRAITSIDEGGITYKISEFKKVNNPKAYLFEMFKEFGFTSWRDIVNLLDAETGKYVSSNTHQLIKHREFLILSDISHSERSHESIQISSEDKMVQTPIGKLIFKVVNHVSEKSKNTIYIDQDKLNFPIEFRLWQKGEVFQPLGMTGKKKVSKFLKDEKLSPFEKEHTWVLCSDDNIVWVIGKRADDRFKITEQTKSILKISMT